MAKTIAMTEELVTAAATINAEFIIPKPQQAYAAVPYVRALMVLPIGATDYFEDSVHTILSYLIGNLAPWKGESAREVKAVIRAAIKEAK